MENLFGKTKEELENIAVRCGEKPFRGRQLYDWIYKHEASDLEDCKNLSKGFLAELKKSCVIDHGKIVRRQIDPEDGTRKYLIELSDGERVETVLMRYEHGLSICLSTQVGCAMGCSFCASALKGKKRDLTAAEMAGQLVTVQKDVGERISNIVLMGMGEPLDNYDNVLQFIRMAGTELGIGQRHITLSTSGIVPKIKRLADEKLQINLAISLHTPFQKEREKIMPVSKAWPIDTLIAAADEYFDKTGRRVTYEYTLIDGVNDRKEDATELGRLFRGKPVHINLIPLNPVTESAHKSSRNVKLFARELQNMGLTSTIRKKNGANIDAACGQLRNRDQEECE